MTDIKVIYKEASKETVENLIGNFSKTIEDLYKKVVEDISLLKELNEDVPQLLRLAVELRMDMRFILIDLMTSLRGSLNVHTPLRNAIISRTLKVLGWRDAVCY